MTLELRYMAKSICTSRLLRGNRRANFVVVTSASTAPSNQTFSQVNYSTCLDGDSIDLEASAIVHQQRNTSGVWS